MSLLEAPAMLSSKLVKRPVLKLTNALARTEKSAA